MNPLPLNERVWLTAASCAELYDHPSGDAFRTWAKRNGIFPSPVDNRRYRRSDIDRFLAGKSKPSQVSA